MKIQVRDATGNASKSPGVGLAGPDIGFASANGPGHFIIISKP